MATEPTQDQLSAYVDGELDAPAHAELEAHLATCTTCRARLAAIRQTVTAIRALPMETPPRTFTVPEQRRQSLRWAPVAGWAGSAAAAVLVIALVATHLPGGGGGTTASTISSRTAHEGAAPLALSQGGVGAQNYAAPADKAAETAQQMTVTAPGRGGESLTIATDARSYPVSGVMTLQVRIQGVSAGEASTVRTVLIRDGYAARLARPAVPGTVTSYSARYAIADLQLSSPQPGSYSLEVTVDLANGLSLVAQLPVAVTP